MIMNMYERISLIIGISSLVVSILSLIVSWKGYVKADKASAEAHLANEKIGLLSAPKELAEELKQGIKALDTLSDKERAYKLIELLKRIVKNEFLFEDQRKECEKLLGSLEGCVDDLGRVLGNKEALSKMSEAEGAIKSVIDMLTFGTLIK